MVLVAPRGEDMSITTIVSSDITANRPVANSRAVPAYVRGIPAFVWQSALRHPGQRRRADAT
jgi:hypothetical protein